MALDAVRYRRQSEAANVNQYVTAAANTACVVTLPGSSSVSHVITSLDWSYSGSAAVTGSITVADGSTTVWSLDISSVDAFSKNFDPPLRITRENACTVTLAAGGSGITGKLAVQGYDETSFFNVQNASNFSYTPNSQYVALLV